MHKEKRKHGKANCFGRTSLQASLLSDWKFFKLTSYYQFFWCNDFLLYLIKSLFMTPYEYWYAMKFGISKESRDNKRRRLVGGVEG